MAKKTSKQGKKANRKNGQQAAASGLSLAAAKKATAEKPEPAKVAESVSEPQDRESQEKKPEKSSGKPEKPAREQQKGGLNPFRRGWEPPKSAKPSKEQQKAAKGGKAAPKKEGVFHKVVTYFKNVRLEIKRTTWPSRMDVLRMSLIVIGTLIFFGILIFILDWVMNWLNTFYAGLVDPAAAPVTDPGVTPDAVTPDASTISDTPATSDAPSTSDTSEVPASDSTQTPSDTSTSGSETTEQ
jgi:preprotein translocase subunit SecE